jgi:hypothetical protein
MKNRYDDNDAEKGMPMNMKGFVILLIGLLVMILGFVLMMGGGSEDPAVFNYDMFDFRRLVLAPLVILAGIIVEVVAIMKVFK